MTATTSKSQIPPALQDYWMATEEASEQIGMTVETVYKKISAGVFETQKYGRRTLISRASVKRYLDQFRHVGR